MKRHIILIGTATLLGCTPFADADPRDPEPKAQPPEMGLSDLLDIEPDIKQDVDLDITPDSTIDPPDDGNNVETPPLLTVAVGQDGVPRLNWDTPKEGQTIEVCIGDLCTEVDGNVWRDINAPWPRAVDGDGFSATSTYRGVDLVANPTFAPQERSYTLRLKNSQGEVLAESAVHRAARSVDDWRIAWQRSTDTTQSNWVQVADLSTFGWGTTYTDTEAPTDGTSQWYRVRYRPDGSNDPYAFSTAIQGNRIAPFEMGLGVSTSCHISNGNVRCWGNGAGGRLGDGETSNKSTPSSILALSASSIAVGFEHACTVNSAGSIHCWGDNTQGQLGTGNKVRSLDPSIVGSGADCVSVGQLHTCAILNSGNVSCWGNGASGQLGGGSTTESLTVGTGWIPPSPLTAIQSGDLFNCGLTTGQGLVCWGSNLSSQLGTANQGDQSTAQPVPNISGVDQFALGASHACAVSAGELRCWGNNFAGQLGYGFQTPTATAQTTTVPVPGNVIEVSAGLDHTCALNNLGDVYCWGANEYGQLGLGNKAPLRSPGAKVPLPGMAQTLYSGARHNCAVVSGEVYCWGQNLRGQLGNGVAGPDENVGDSAGETPARVTIP